MGGPHGFAQRRQAVNALLHGRPFGDGLAVARFYRAVVLKKGNVVDSSFDAPNVAELVIPLDGSRHQEVFDPSAFDADVVAVAHLILVVGGERAPQKRGQVVRVDAVKGGARPGFVDGRQVPGRCKTMSLANAT